MAKNRTKAKPPLTLEEHQMLGKVLHEMSNALSALGHDLGERYAVRVAGPVLRAVAAVDAVRGALDSILWHEQRGRADRATLDRVYYPGTGGGLASLPAAEQQEKEAKAAAVTSFASPAVPKQP